jgi:DNA-binding NarL/FixJ family response regulator
VSGWDLVLMDVDLPGMNGIACTRQIKQLQAAAVVVLTVFEERATIIEAICAGADGYLLKRTTAAELLSQLRAIAGRRADLIRRRAYRPGPGPPPRSRRPATAPRAPAGSS